MQINFRKSEDFDFIKEINFRKKISKFTFPLDFDFIKGNGNDAKQEWIRLCDVESSSKEYPYSRIELRILFISSLFLYLLYKFSIEFNRIFVSSL
ncbi:hypothetical protein RIR_jg21715.t1 [Rhizophagus irregularis DAOM 181602=DAOM 197198]|nr:hypothetical protein RIR_jg21715.t1 [Rhizophagus irregularis DAOM 181602=DAOM 197198]